jgi:glycosyltransferase involved in cell wall biosynthesis
MNRITICIPSYKRPELLRKLILSIVDSRLNKSLISDVNIVVVDNDSLMTAESTVIELKEKFHNTYKIDYFSFPIKGLANVRNELLRKSLILNPDFIVFIDDDEYASPEWLNNLVETIIVNKGDLAVGPVKSVVDSNVSKYLSCWFHRRDYPDNAKLNFTYTGNLIIRTESLLKHNIWFDNRFNKTGGEDSYFGQQMLKRGATIYWSAKAIVFETIPSGRANIKWLSNRYYNGANKFAYILKIEKRFSKILKKILISMLYIIIGFCGLVLLPFPGYKKYWGILKISEGFGGINGLLGRRYNEYK